MDLKLTDLTTILDFLTSANYWGLPLLFSITVPIFYIGFKKLAEKNEGTSDGLKAFVTRVFTLPTVEGWVLAFSITCFVVGCFTVVYGANRREAIRLNGLQVKAYMRSQNYYLKTVDQIQQDLGLDDNDLANIAENFPSDFVKKRHAFFNESTQQRDAVETIYLADSVLRKQIMVRATKLLDAYLANNFVLETGGIKSYDSLFYQNDFFTREVVDQLIIDSSHKYTLNYVVTVNGKKEFGIVKKDNLVERVKILEAYLSNPFVMQANSVRAFSELQAHSPLFTKEVVEKLLCTKSDKYQLNLMDVDHPEKGFGITKR